MPPISADATAPNQSALTPTRNSPSVLDEKVINRAHAPASSRSVSRPQAWWLTSCDDRRWEAGARASRQQHEPSPDIRNINMLGRLAPRQRKWISTPAATNIPTLTCDGDVVAVPLCRRVD